MDSYHIQEQKRVVSKWIRDIADAIIGDNLRLCWHYYDLYNLTPDQIHDYIWTDKELIRPVNKCFDISANPYVDTTAKEGPYTAYYVNGGLLKLACTYASAAVVKWVLNRGNKPTPDQINKYLKYSIYEATKRATSDQLDILNRQFPDDVPRIIEFQNDISKSKPLFGISPLVSACMCGDMTLLRQIITLDPNAPKNMLDSIKTIWAYCGGDERYYKLKLVKREINEYATQYPEHKALQEEVHLANFNAIITLIREGTDPDDLDYLDLIEKPDDWTEMKYRHDMVFAIIESKKFQPAVIAKYKISIDEILLARERLIDQLNARDNDFEVALAIIELFKLNSDNLFASKSDAKYQIYTRLRSEERRKALLNVLSIEGH